MRLEVGCWLVPGGVSVPQLVLYCKGEDRKSPCAHAVCQSEGYSVDAEQGIKLLGLLLTGSTGQRMASRNGLA